MLSILLYYLDKGKKLKRNDNFHTLDELSNIVRKLDKNIEIDYSSMYGLHIGDIGKKKPEEVLGIIKGLEDRLGVTSLDWDIDVRYTVYDCPRNNLEECTIDFHCRFKHNVVLRSNLPSYKARMTFTKNTD